MFAVVVAEHFLILLHCPVIAEVIQLAADHLPLGLHHAAGVEIIVLPVQFLPAFHHLSLVVQVVGIAVQIEKAVVHRTVCVKVVPCAGNVLESGAHHAVRCKIILFAADILPAGLHGVIAVEIIDLSAVRRHPTRKHFAVLVIIRGCLVRKGAESQLLLTVGVVQQIALAVLLELSGLLAGLFVGIVTVVAVGQPAADHLPGLRVIIAAHAVDGTPAGFLHAGVIKQIVHAVDLLLPGHSVSGFVEIPAHAVFVLPAGFAGHGSHCRCHRDIRRFQLYRRCRYGTAQQNAAAQHCPEGCQDADCFSSHRSFPLSRFRHCKQRREFTMQCAIFAHAPISLPNFHEFVKSEMQCERKSIFQKVCLEKLSVGANNVCPGRLLRPSDTSSMRGGIY